MDNQEWLIPKCLLEKIKKDIINAANEDINKIKPSKYLIGIDESNGIDYTVKSYKYKDSKGVIRIVKTIIDK